MYILQDEYHRVISPVPLANCPLPGCGKPLTGARWNDLRGYDGRHMRRLAARLQHRQLAKAKREKVTE